MKSVLLGLVVATFVVSCSEGAGEGVAVGTLERNRIELVAEAFESVVSVLVREGDTVEVGDVLVRLDPQRAEIRLGVAMAGRDAAAAFGKSVV